MYLIICLAKAANRFLLLQKTNHTFKTSLTNIYVEMRRKLKSDEIGFYGFPYIQNLFSI